MLDHLSIQCADVTASARFYDAVLPAIGGERVMDLGEVIGYGAPPKPDFWIGPQSTGTGFRESHLAFAAPNRTAVRRSSTRRWPKAPRFSTNLDYGPSTTPTTTPRSFVTLTATTSRRSATRRSEGSGQSRGEGP